MKKYRVTLPVTGSLSFIVEADSEKEAITEGLAAEVDMEDEETSFEWETHRVVTEGNVCYANPNRASAEEEEDE